VSANLDLVRSVYADWERGDLTRTDWADPEIEFVSVDGLTPASVEGLKATSEQWREVLADWADFRAEGEEYRELDDERALGLHRLIGRGRTSGVEVGPTGAKGTCLFRVVNGKVTMPSLYWVRDRALADLGLEE